MSEESEAARSKRKAADGGADRLSALSEGLLLDLLSFLPSRDAVRTCVLARRWRNRWKAVPAIRITPSTTSGYSSASALNRFVNYLLFSRNRLSLHVAELNSRGGAGFNEAVQYLELWIRYSLSCPVAKLSVTVSDHKLCLGWPLPKGLIISEHLTALVLTRVQTRDDLDFSSCVSLKDLKITDCGVYCDRIMSQSLKRLLIAQCHFAVIGRTQICVPNLVLLLLVDCTGMTPLLVSMPYLVDACVRLKNCIDVCKNSYEIGDCGDESCRGCHFCEKSNGNNDCILLHGLSTCTNLELTAATRSHSPLLEKLIIQFEPPKIYGRLVELGASYDLSKQPLVLKDLIVEVWCDDGDEHIHKVLDVLGSYGLPPEKIKIQRPPKLTRARFGDTWTSGSFSFEQI